MTILESLMKLNETLMLQGYTSDFKIILKDKDFEKFVTYFEMEYKCLLFYPELRASLKDITQVKIAGPGSYFHIHRDKA